MINKIYKIVDVRPGVQRKMEVQIRDVESGEILYQNISEAGVLCTMEKVLPIVAGEVEGTHQILLWGNMLVQGHCILMLRQNMSRSMDDYIAEAEKHGVFFSDEYKTAVKRKSQG